MSGNQAAAVGVPVTRIIDQGDLYVTYPNYTSIDAQAGAGGEGLYGGADGGAGGSALVEIMNVSGTVPSTDPLASIEVDAYGGDGGAGADSGATDQNGGDGGDGGSSTVILNGVTSVSTFSTDISFDVGSGNGGQAGFATSTGGNGGNGGVAQATITNNDITANSGTISIQVDVSGGVGGGAGDGGIGFVSPGDGGSGGSASLIFSDNQIVARLNSNLDAYDQAIFVTLDANEGLKGAYSTTEAAGQNGLVNIVLFNNFIESDDLNLDIGATVYTGNNPIPTISTNPLNGAVGGNLVFNGNSFVGYGASIFSTDASGVVINTANNTISIDGSQENSFVGFTNFYLGQDNEFVVGSGSYHASLASDPDMIVFTPVSGSVMISGATGSNLDVDFQGFDASLTLQGIQSSTSHSNGNTIFDLPGGGTLELLGYTGSLPADDITFDLACYCQGTRIHTPSGERLIESLAPGDIVTTHDGDARPVIWLGHRRVECARHRTPRTVLPIRVQAGAFGCGLPHRDLFLSPDHAAFVDGLLIPIRCLVNGTTITQQRVAQTIYWHVELDQHAVILAEGLPCESYLDTGNRAGFANAGVALQHRPSFDYGCWEADACAPTVEQGFRLEAIYQRLLGLARSLRAA